MQIYVNELKAIIGLVEYLNEGFNKLIATDTFNLIDSNGEVCGSIEYENGEYVFNTKGI